MVDAEQWCNNRKSRGSYTNLLCELGPVLDLALYCVLSSKTVAASTAVHGTRDAMEIHMELKIVDCGKPFSPSTTQPPRSLLLVFPLTGHLSGESITSPESCVSLPTQVRRVLRSKWRDRLCFHSFSRDHWLYQVWIHCLLSFLSLCLPLEKSISAEWQD